MTKNWTKIISRFRILIMCFAVVIYSLPSMAMASSDMMAHDMSIDQQCDEGMTDHADVDMSCCDKGDCDYSCTGLSVAITNIQTSPLGMSRQSHKDRFINHLTGVDLTRDSPPPQA